MAEWIAEGRGFGMNGSNGGVDCRGLSLQGKVYRHIIEACLAVLVFLFTMVGARAGNPAGANGLSVLQMQNPPAFQGTIVAVGDSLTAGLGVDEDQAYPAQLQKKLLRNGFAYKVINAGISGETSSGALARIQWVTASLKPDIVILETGANDGLRGIDPKLLASNLDQIVSFLKQQKITIVLAGMRMLSNLGPRYVKAFNRIYAECAQKYDVILIPFILEGVAGDPLLNQADRIHPTAQGYTRIVETIYPYIVKAIERHLKRG